MSMKLGIGLHCLRNAIRSKEMSPLDVIEWIAEVGGEHVEIVPVDFDLLSEPEMADAIREKAEQVGIAVSNYCVRANFITPDEAAYEREIEHVIKHVDIARRLGVKLMRHDVASRPFDEATLFNYQQDLPKLAHACRTIADYAAKYGITTSVENHGYHTQASERIQSLIYAVDRSNFKTTLDIGNFLCVDEDPLSGVRNNIGFASMIHIKDFYIRPPHRNPGEGSEGWLVTRGGNHLRGSILGQGDIDIKEILRVIKESGYDGYLSIEFEGMEECRTATRIGFDNARRMWNEL